MNRLELAVQIFYQRLLPWEENLRLKRKIKVGIDSPSAAGAGTISKMLAKNYNLLYCDTGKIYRYMAKQIIDRKPDNKIKFYLPMKLRMLLRKSPKI